MQSSAPHWSLERLWVNVTAQGAFVIDVPAPVGARTSIGDWAGNASVPAGWTVTAVTVEHGLALRVEGSGPGGLASCALHGDAGGVRCCAEDYMDSVWSTGGGTHPDSVLVQLAEGNASLTIAYSARSNLCGARAGFGGDLQPGWSSVAGEAQMGCT